ncbi:hypothetical protein ACFWJT_32040 [Streptomyces sp. NPDC127069]|uniref:hypothetical protein n=1 Tax=Streptomyces sp. NPDC127069 TaxID=3347128 RepID=UPI003661A28D
MVRSRVVALVVAGAASVSVLSGVAVAADLNAPYARAAAKVAADGTLLEGKNVASVTRAGAGTYCVKVSDAAIDLASAAVVATLNNNRGEITAIGAPHGYCGNATDTITVVTSNSAGTGTDRPFTVAVL